MSKDGVFHIPRLDKKGYRVSWEVDSYDVDVLGATFMRDGQKNTITGFAAPHWKEVQVRAWGNIGGDYTGLQRDWSEDERTAEPSEGSRMAGSGPERWCTVKHVYPVDKDPELRETVDSLVANNDEE
jgi:hypothetical protein